MYFQHWKSRAKIKNEGFHIRWKNIWDDGFPHEWNSFLLSNATKSQSKLCKNIEKEQAREGEREFKAATYKNFVPNLYQKYCENWCEVPQDDIYEAMYSSFAETCGNVVLKDYRSSLIPSWVTDILEEEFYHLLDMYISTFNPTSLVHPCRSVLKKGESAKLISLFQTTTQADIRECLFHVNYL